MERQVGTLGILGIVLVALGALVGLGFAAFSLSRGTSSDGVQEVASQVEYVSKSKFDTFNDREVSGTVLKTFMEQSKGNHIVFAISHRAFKSGQKVVQNRWVMGHNQAIYCIYGKIPEKEIGAAWYKVNVGDDCPKWTNEAYLFEKKDSCSLIFKGTFSNMSDFNYESLNMVGSPEYIDSASSYKCNLIYDVNDSVIGVIARQQNRPTAAKRDVSVFEVDSVLGHINKTDGGNIPLAPVVVWGESGGKQTLIREDGKAGSGFGSVGLSKDEVDTSGYDAIPDNSLGDFVFEDEAKTILIGYKGSSAFVKIPDSVTHVKSLTSDGTNPEAYTSSLEVVNSIVFNAGCVKIENLNLDLMPNIRSVYLSPTTTVIGGTKLNMVQIEAPIHLKAQINSCVEGDVFKDNWSDKLYDCGCPACKISEDDWVYVWDGLDIVGYVGTLPKNLEVPYGCTGLGPRALIGGTFETITLPVTTTNIGKEAFSGCNNLKEIDISSCKDMIELGDKTFNSCKSLKKVTLASSIQVIGVDCFRNCASLNSIYGFGGVREVKSFAFFDCYLLKFLDDSSSLETVGDRGFYATQLGDSICFDNLKEIGSNSFGALNIYGDKIQRELIIPGTLTTISNSAFYLLRADVVRLEEGIQRLEGSCFADSSSLTDLYIPASVTYISSTAFKGSSNVTLHFAEGSPFLADGGAIYNEDYTVLLKGPTNLTASDTFIIRDTCKEIASNAFSNCNVGNIVIPSSLKTICSYAFVKAPNIKELRITPNITSISFLGAGSSIEKLVIEGGTNIGMTRCLSEGGHNVREIIVEGNNPNYCVVDGALYYKDIFIGVCRGVTNLKLIDTCNRFLQYSVKGTDIEYIDLNNCKTLDNLAFAYASKLTSINAPNVEVIGARVGEGTKIKSVNFPKAKKISYSSNGISSYYGTIPGISDTVVFGKNLERLGSYVFYTGGQGPKVLDLSACILITEIESNCFKSFKQLTNLKLPPNLVTIRETAFDSILTDVMIELPESVELIEGGAFVNCPKVKLKAPRHLKGQNTDERWGIPESRITWY